MVELCWYSGFGQVVEAQSRQPVGNGTVQVYEAGNSSGYGAVGPAYACDATSYFALDFVGRTG